MKVEVLVVPDCPHSAPAVARVRAALTDVGLARTPVATVVIESENEAQRRGFPGSPTILIDGEDPFAEAGQRPALACRLYQTPAGPAGVPDIRMLRQAFKRAADANRRRSDAG